MTDSKKKEILKLTELSHGVQKTLKIGNKDRAEILLFLESNGLKGEPIYKGGYTLLISKKPKP
jgi:hypothetical protein